MIRPEQDIFIQRPAEAKLRILHPARTVTVRGDRVRLILSEPQLPLEPQLNIRVFYEAREFMQQTATVIELPQKEGEEAITIALTSQPVSAESRECYRVSTVVSDLTATVGSETRCKLVDVSAMGFAVIANEPYQIGHLVDTELRFEGRAYPGKSCVQSVRDLGAGRARYGLLPLASDGAQDRMFAGMQYMANALQRQQLKRLSGAVQGSPAPQ